MTDEKTEKKPGGSFETTRAILLAAVIALAIRSFIVEPFKIPSGSMIPTLLVGDYVLVNKSSYGVRLPITGTLLFETGEPSRGDVIVFRYPDDRSQDFIKRLVGLSGDRIEIRQRRLWINGQPLDRVDEGESHYLEVETRREVDVERYRETSLDGEEYTIIHRLPRSPNGFRNGPWIVPEGKYFMMGDNRDNSADSRVWHNHFVAAEDIKGRAFMIHWSWIVEYGEQDRAFVVGLMNTLWRLVTFQIEDVRWERIGRWLAGVAAEPPPLTGLGPGV